MDDSTAGAVQMLDDSYNSSQVITTAASTCIAASGGNMNSTQKR